MTNIRQDPNELYPHAESRGYLTRNFVIEPNLDPQMYLNTVQKQANLYNGFNLIVGNVDGSCWFYGNKFCPTDPVELASNTVYGMSNGNFLDSKNWPKVDLGKSLFLKAIQESKTQHELYTQLLDLLQNKTVFPDDQLPSIFDVELERKLSSICIDSDTESNYGTRTHTIIIVDNDHQVLFSEVDRYIQKDRIFEQGHFEELFEFKCCQDDEPSTSGILVE